MFSCEGNVSRCANISSLMAIAIDTVGTLIYREFSENPSIVEYALKLHPDEDVTKDKQGMTSLIFAASRKVKSSNCFFEYQLLTQWMVARGDYRLTLLYQVDRHGTMELL